jgi:hypothetical protein
MQLFCRHHNCNQIVQSFFMENTNDKRLTFPQRNWLLMCLLTVFIVMFVDYFIGKNRENRNTNYNNVQTSSPSSLTGDTQNAQGVPPDSLRH